MSTAAIFGFGVLVTFLVVGGSFIFTVYELREMEHHPERYPKRTTNEVPPLVPGSTGNATE